MVVEETREGWQRSQKKAEKPKLLGGYQSFITYMDVGECGIMVRIDVYFLVGIGRNRNVEWREGGANVGGLMKKREMGKVRESERGRGRGWWW